MKNGYLLILLSSKADTHFINPQRVEGEVDLGGWFTHLQMVTHPTTNRAQRRITSLIETSALLLSQTSITM